MRTPCRFAFTKTQKYKTDGNASGLCLVHQKHENHTQKYRKSAVFGGKGVKIQRNSSLAKCAINRISRRYDKFFVFLCFCEKEI